MTDRSFVRHDWLNLIEVSGPFLAVPVLEDVFPQGLEGLETSRARRLRNAHDEWRVAVDGDDPDLAELHGAWIDEVITTTLEMDASVLRRGADVSDRLQAALPEHGVTLIPDIALVDPSHDDAPLLLVQVLEPDADLDATRRFDGLAATPAERMVMLLRGTGSPVGLVTNGEQWMLVHAPVGSVASFASWYARLWGQEPETLRAFVSLLGVRRFFGPEDERLPALYERSLKHQDEVTEALGEQVRRAVEVLVQAVDRADQDRNRELLRNTEPRELYEAALTVMMRLVFLLAAEERGLLLLNDERYDAHYALSTLRMQLRSESEEILERRRSAWSRLLALFRAVYGGIEHPALRLPPLGGSLFDPDRYPFLEGRLKGTSWRTHPAEPLPIDDRTVLLLLEAIQIFEGRALSYRALDVEQIGHVYEGLLERTVKRVEDVTLELEASAKAKDPRVTMGELESAALDGRERVVKLLGERSQRSASGIRNALERAPDERLNARLLTVCRGDIGLRDRILPYAHLLRTDPWSYPLVHHAGAFVVVLGADRRETGTHYTPKSLTEKIVEETLTPLVYRGPAVGEPREAWDLKQPDELLDLKVCDPSMGSGAFLVQACRFLSERLVEAWAREETEGRAVDVDGRVHPLGESFEPLPADVEERTVMARRLVAERCLYGVDLNPLAVELAKMSLWLTTLAKGRPFDFLDHHLKSGDSLLGIHDLRQLIELRMRPEGARQLRLFGQSIERAVQEAVELRQLITSVPVRDIRDVEEMAGLEAEAREKLQVATALADAFIDTVFAGGSEGGVEARLAALAAEADRLAGDFEPGKDVVRQAAFHTPGRTHAGQLRRPFHWPLEFPEVFDSTTGGFDAVVGNPPWQFLSGKGSPVARLRRLGEQEAARNLDVYLSFLTYTYPHFSQKARDICKWFVCRALQILRPRGNIGLLLPTSVLELSGYRDVRIGLCSHFDTLEATKLGFGYFDAVVSCSIVVGRGRNAETKSSQEILFFDASRESGGSVVPFRQRDGSGEWLELRDGDIQFFKSQFAERIYSHSTVTLGDIADIREGCHHLSFERQQRSIHVVDDRSFSLFQLPTVVLGIIDGPMPDPELHSGERFIIRKTGDEIVAALVPTAEYAPCHQNVYVCKPKLDSGWTAKSLCGLLCSSHMTRLYQDGPSGQKGRPMAQFRVSSLRALPIPAAGVGLEGQAMLEAAYDQMLATGDRDAVDNCVEVAFHMAGWKSP